MHLRMGRGHASLGYEVSRQMKLDMFSNLERSSLAWLKNRGNVDEQAPIDVATCAVQHFRYVRLRRFISGVQ